MHNIQLILYNIFKNIKFSLVFLCQLIIIILLLYNFINVLQNNLNIKHQLEPNNFKQMYEVDTVKRSSNGNILVSNSTSYEDLYNFINEEVFDIHLSYNIIFNNKKENLKIIKNEDNYNHKFIYTNTNNNLKGIPITVGNKLNIDGFINKQLYIEISGENIPVYVDKVLDQKQYYFEGNTILPADYQIVANFKDLFDNFKDINNKNILINNSFNNLSFINKKEISKEEYLNVMYKKFNNLGMEIHLEPSIVVKDSLYLILKDAMDTMIFEFIFILVICIICIINYLNSLFNLRSKIYAVLILNGYELLDIYIQLFIELVFFILIESIITYAILSYFIDINIILFTSLNLIIFLIFFIQIVLIYKYDNLLEKSLKGAK